MKRFTLMMFALPAMVVLVSCGGGGDATSPVTTGGGGTGGGGSSIACSSTFCMGSATFQPSTATVARNATVSWTNNSGIAHNVTFANPTAAQGVSGGTSGNIFTHSSGTNTRTFTTTGSYTFECTIHGSSMSGTVIVQ